MPKRNSHGDRRKRAVEKPPAGDLTEQANQARAEADQLHRRSERTQQVQEDARGVQLLLVGFEDIRNERG